MTRPGPEYAATLHLLADPTSAPEPRAHPSRLVRLPSTLHRSRSDVLNPRMLIRAAWDIWTCGRDDPHGFQPANIGRAAAFLSDGSIRRLNEAIAIYRRSPTPPRACRLFTRGRRRVASEARREALLLALRQAR